MPSFRITRKEAAARVAKLTPREHEIACLISEADLPRPLMAKKMYRSVKTLDTHVQNIKRKLEVRTIYNIPRIWFAAMENHNES